MQSWEKLQPSCLEPRCPESATAPTHATSSLTLAYFWATPVLCIKALPKALSLQRCVCVSELVMLDASVVAGWQELCLCQGSHHHDWELPSGATAPHGHCSRGQGHFCLWRHSFCLCTHKRGEPWQELSMTLSDAQMRHFMSLVSSATCSSELCCTCQHAQPTA